MDKIELLKDLATLTKMVHDISVKHQGTIILLSFPEENSIQCSSDFNCDGKTFGVRLFNGNLYDSNYKSIHLEDK